MAPKAKVCKKPAAASNGDVEHFIESYLGCCSTPLSLPYPDKGGRRADLIPNCGEWVRASRDDEGWIHFAKGTMNAGFRAIHEANRQDSPNTWDLTNEKAASWSKQMTSRLQHLLRHCKQAEGAMPKWLQHALDGTSPAAKIEAAPEIEADEAAAVASLADVTDADFTAALQEDVDDAEGGEEEEPVHDPLVSSEVGQIAFEGWLCEYSWEAENAVRRKEFELNPTAEYAKELVPRPHLGGDAPVLALWPDGYRRELENIVQSEE